ncbi:MAG: hypothetical protein Q7R70_05445 [Candidatus Diapherotrites archaeon]|nr:hypothetical protein [Candidatus Diapherotrites archaeon]
MNKSRLTPQMILGYSGESSSSCSEVQAKALLKKIKEKSKAIIQMPQPSAARLNKLHESLKKIDGF